VGFFKRFFGTKEGVRDSRLQAEAMDAAQGLDIDAAVAAHLQWKRQLQARLNEGRDPSPDVGPAAATTAVTWVAGFMAGAVRVWAPSPGSPS